MLLTFVFATFYFSRLVHDPGHLPQPDRRPRVEPPRPPEGLPHLQLGRDRRLDPDCPQPKRFDPHGGKGPHGYRVRRVERDRRSEQFNLIF